MNEASSKYVDQLALDRLVSEKLEKVHHYPQKKIDLTRSVLFDLNELGCKPIPVFTKHDYGYTFPSIVSSEYPQNNICPVYAYECENARASIVFQHGLFEDNRTIYSFLFQNFNRLGLNVYLCTLPFHYERKPECSAFSGEFFWSADIDRTRKAFIQGAYDVYSVYQFVQSKNNHSIILTGFSMGGAVNLIIGAIRDTIKGIVAINPAASLSEIVWDSPLCRTIKRDFLEAGYTLEQLKVSYKTFEPVSIDSLASPSDRFMICYGIYDQVTSTDQYRELIRKWNITQQHEYKSGHLNTLRVPRLAQDISNFIDRL